MNAQCIGKRSYRDMSDTGSDLRCQLTAVVGSEYCRFHHPDRAQRAIVGKAVPPYSGECDTEDGVHVIRHGQTCTICGREIAETDPREKGDDDGQEYGDPREARADRA